MWEIEDPYSAVLATFHERAYEGVLSMARTKREKFEGNLEPLVRTMGWEWVIEKLGPGRVIEQVGVDRFIDWLKHEKRSKRLTPQQRPRLKRLLEE